MGGSVISPRPTDDSHRVTLLHEIASGIDERTIAYDPPHVHLPVSEHVRELTIQLGVVAAAEDPLERVEELLHLMVLGGCWLEHELREQAA
jgi:hypothetical protein